MALDKVLKIYDEQGNPVDYDILASDVKFLPDGKDLPTKLTEMEDAIEDAAESGGYTPPQGGIPKTDLAPSVQTSLGLADTALQPADKTQLQNAINSLQSALDTLIGSGNVQGAIDTFNEVKAFLDGIDTDDPTLFNQLKSLSDAITALQTALAGKISGIKANGASTTLPVDQNGIVELPPAGSTISPATAAPSMDGTAAVGSSAKYAREDHVHPHDTSKADDNVVVKSVTINGETKQPSNGNVSFIVAGSQGPKGDTGNVNINDADELVTILVNDLTTGGAGNILSAEMGRRLAMMSGTYAQAWARSKAIPYPFCFLWIETVDGDAISKPIWHKGNSVFVDAAGSIVNVDAAAVPNAPTITGATGGAEVPKNTQITITPAAGSALYYSLDGGTTYNISDAAVTVALANAGSVSIVAYCANNKGNSSNATLNITVAGTPVPVFSPSQGEVARGGYVTISVPSGGELHYKVGSGSWQTASGTSASVQITGNTTIQAYNIQDGDTSNTVTGEFTMAALAAPTFLPASGTELPIGGGEVELSAATGATIYYTTDGSTPTTSSTQYNGTAIQVTEAMTIKAIAVDTYGSSAVAEASYTVKEDAIIIDTTDATASVTLGYKDTSDASQTVTFNLDSAVTSPVGSGYRNTIALNNTNFPNLNTSKQFSSISFSDKTKLKRIYGGGAAIPASFDGASALVYYEANIGSGNANLYRSFYNTPGWSVFKVSGTAGSFQGTFRCSSINASQTIDLTGLVPYSDTGFSNVNGLVTNQSGSTLKINGSFKIASNATKKAVVEETIRVTVKNLEIHSDTPPDLTVDWFAALVAQAVAKSTTISLKVPAGKIDTYKASTGWSAYADHANVTWGEIS